MTTEQEAQEDRVYISLTVEVNGQQAVITREALLAWPGGKLDPRAILKEVVAEMDEALVQREMTGAGS